MLFEYSYCETLRNKKQMKTYKLEDLTDKYIGEKGTKDREDFDNELKLDLLDEAPSAQDSQPS